MTKEEQIKELKEQRKKERIKELLEQRKEERSRGILRIHHNAGFFSCCTVKLKLLYEFLARANSLPKGIISHQFMHYQSSVVQDLASFYFKENKNNIKFLPLSIKMTGDGFAPYWNGQHYKNIKAFDELLPFVEKYFTPSDIVEQYVNKIEKKYDINYSKTIGVYFRGLDKKIEADVPPYETFLEKSEEVLNQNPDIKFFVQTDELEFRQAFLKRFPNNSFYNEEMPTKSSIILNETQDQKEQLQHKGIHFDTPIEDRPFSGVQILSTALILAKCSQLILSTSNVSFWAVLYRGNTEGVFQWRNQKIKWR